MAINVYRIGDSSEVGSINIITNKKRITEAEFWAEFEQKLNEVTETRPDKRRGLSLQCRELLKKGKQVTIKNRCFEISCK